MELERDSLKGLAKLTKKGELQSRIDRKNEEIDLLKIGLSGIANRYGFQTVHDFYKTFAVSKTANAEYRDKAGRWEEKYGENTGIQEKESVYKRLQNHQRGKTDRQTKQTLKSKNRGRDDCPSRFYNICSTAVKYLYIYLLCCRFCILDILNEPFKY